MRLPVLTIRFWLLFTVASVSSCTSFDAAEVADLKIYGHAGSGLKPEQYNFPPNSLISIKKAILADGADGIEIDVQMSRDSVLFLFHDDRLQGNTNGKGRIADLDSNYIGQLYYRKSFLGNEKESVLSFSELLLWYKENDIKAGLSINIQRQFPDGENQNFENIEIKILHELVKTLPDDVPLFIESPIDHQLDYLVTVNGREVILWDNDINEETITFALLKKYDGMVSSYRNTNKESIQLAKDKGLITVLFGLKIYPNIREAFSLNPDFVQTDNVPLTKSLRDE